MNFNFDANAFIYSIESFLKEYFIPSLSEGNIFSIAILGIFFGFLIIIAFKGMGWIFSIFKRFFLALLIFISLYFFIINFWDKIFAETPDLLIVSVGAAGLLLGFLALFISFIAFHSQVKPKIIEMRVPGIDKTDEVKIVSTDEKPEIAKKIVPRQEPTFFSRGSFKQQIRSDKSLLAVLSYVIIAEFGVFSSITTPAPNVSVGITFFVVFLLGAFVFIRATYASYKKGVFHLLVTATFGFILSILLGHFWVGIELPVLLSLEYFKTNSLVAMVTGMAISLFMGSRG